MEYGQETDAELIDLSYAALVGEASWQDFLDGLSGRVPDGRTILFSCKVDDLNDHIALTSQFEGPEIESYTSHYVHSNPWLEHCAVRKIGLGVYSDEIVRREMLESTEFYNDWMIPNDVACSVGVTIDKNGTCPVIVSTLTSRTHAERNKSFSEQLTRIAPHLRRAARFYRNKFAGWSSYQLGMPLYDDTRIGIVIVGENARPKSLSQTAEAYIQRAKLATMTPLGQIQIRDQDSQAILRSMLKRNYDGPKAVVVRMDAGKITLVRMEVETISLIMVGPTVIVILEEPDSGQRYKDVSHFAEAYGVSVAEQRALKGVIEGKSVTEIADVAGVSRETIRTQLKSLYAKTNVRSQADLLRLFGLTVGFKNYGEY